MMNHLSIPQYLLESSFCLGILYLFYSLFLKKETHFQFNRAYLILSSMFSLVIPIINIDFSKTSHITGADHMFPILSTVDAFQLGINQTITQQNNVLQISVADVITYIYIAGLFIMTLKLASGLFKLFGIINRSPKMKDTDHTLLISDDVPASSFFSYIFWQDTHDKNDKVQKTILDHEMVHVRQWHSLDVIVMELMVIVKWFNPLIYLFRNSLKQTHEFIADKYVSEKMMDKISYANILLTNKATTSLPPATNHFYGHIRERVKMLSTKKSNAYSQLKYIGAIPVILVLFSFFSFDLSDRLPDKIKSPFQQIEHSMLATADQKVISLNMDEEIEKEKFYLNWSDVMKVVLTQKYETQDLILKYSKDDLNTLLSDSPSIVQNGKPLNITVDTLEVLINNRKMNIDLNQLKSKHLRTKFIDSLGINDQILIRVKSYSETDSLRLNLHLSLNENVVNKWTFASSGITDVIKWGDLKVDFEDMINRKGVWLDLDNSVSQEQFYTMLDQKIQLRTDADRFEEIEPNRSITFKYMKSRHVGLASIDAEAIANSKKENNVKDGVVYLTSYYHGENYRIIESSFSMSISEFYESKEDFKSWLANAQNGDNIAVSISKANATSNAYEFNLRFRDEEAAISAPFAIDLPHTQNSYSNYQIVMNSEGKSLVRVDVNGRDSRRIAAAYEGSQSYEIVHIDGFRSKQHVYNSNLPQGKLEYADIMDPVVRNLDKFRINDYYTDSDNLIRMKWGKMISMPGIGNFSLKEFKRSSNYGLNLMAGVNHIQMDRFDLVIIPENGKIKRIRTDQLNMQKVRDVLNEVKENTSIYIDNIIVNVSGERYFYPYSFVYTVE